MGTLGVERMKSESVGTNMLHFVFETGGKALCSEGGRNEVSSLRKVVKVVDGRGGGGGQQLQEWVLPLSNIGVSAKVRD